MTRIRVAVVLAAFLIVPLTGGLSYAQSRRVVKTKKKAPKPHVYKRNEKKAKSYSFMADEVDGNRINPDGTMIWGVQAKKHRTLIRHRTHFMPEILKSAESI